MVWQAEGQESRQAEGDDEPDIEKLGRDETVQAVGHPQPAQQRGHEGGQHDNPQAPAPMPNPSAVSNAPATATRAIRGTR